MYDFILFWCDFNFVKNHSLKEHSQGYHVHIDTHSVWPRHALIHSCGHWCFVCCDDQYFKSAVVWCDTQKQNELVFISIPRQIKCTDCVLRVRLCMKEKASPCCVFILAARCSFSSTLPLSLSRTLACPFKSCRTSKEPWSCFPARALQRASMRQQSTSTNSGTPSLCRS